MNVESIREDEKYVAFQKQAYDEFNERTRMEVKMAQSINDYDLKSHLEQLEAYHIKGNDFAPIPLKDVQLDFVNDLLTRYLTDIKGRMKAGAFGKATTSMLLRKCVKLSDIDLLVEECEIKSNALLSNADKLALKLAEEKRLKETKNNIKRIAFKKLDMDQGELKKRSNSWKGKVKPFLGDFEYDEWDDAVHARGRPHSRMFQRRQMNPRIAKEHENLAPGEAVEGGADDDSDGGEPRMRGTQDRLAGLMPAGSNDMMA